MFLVCFLYEWGVKVLFGALVSTALKYEFFRSRAVRFIKWAKRKGYYE